MITAARRRSLPASAFAYPRTRKYPLDTLKRAKSALSRAASSKNSGTYSHVAKKVRAKWGNKVASVGKARGTTSRPGYAKRSRTRSSSSARRRR